MSKKEIIENVSTEENELVEAIKDTDATDEEVVEAVAEAEKQEKTVEEVVNEIVEEVVNEIVEESKDDEKSDEKNLDKKCKLRGFESYKHAKDYLKSESFKKLDSLNQAELKGWFENLK